MHVLAFENKPTVFAGGQERSLFEVLKFLASHGDRVSLCFQEPGELLEQYKPFLQESFQIQSRRFAKPWLRLLYDLARLTLKSLSAKWDVLYGNQYFDAPVIAALGILTRTPSVCHLRLECPTYLSRQYRWGLMRCTRLITISEDTKQGYISAGIPEEKLQVIYNGIDVSAFSPRPSTVPDASRARRIKFFGRLCPDKGPEILIEAVRRLQAEGSQVELQLIGNVRNAGPDDAAYLQTLKTLAGSLLDKNIFFKPHQADIRCELADADLVVVPSIWREPFGRVVVEAMASEVPVVASDTGGLPEVLGPEFKHHLVPKGDASALAALISKLASWRETQPDLGARSRQRVVENFSHEMRFSQIQALLRGLVDAEQSSEDDASSRD